MAQIKLPPHSEDVEKAVLGNLLLDRESMMDVAGWLRQDHFYNTHLGAIYGAMWNLYEERKQIDMVTVGEELKKMKMLKQVGGLAMLAELTGSAPVTADVTEYARMIYEYAVKRNLILVAGKLADAGFDEAKSLRELLDQAEAEVFALADMGNRESFVSIKDVLSDSFDRLDELQKQADGLRGVPTGFGDLDNALAGMQNSNLLILAARPGTGKTALALNIAQHVSTIHKKAVGIFSLEMSSDELVNRLLVAQADIDAWTLKTGRLGNEESARLADAMGELAEAPIYIDDSPGLSILEIRTRARRLKMMHGIQLLIVDYLQLAHASRKAESRVQEVGEVSQGLKNIARELKIPVLSLSQLSRAVEQRGGVKKPQLSDLRESGSIEQDADVVMFLWREDDDDLTRVNLSIEKHRNGPLRTVPLYFRGDRIKFYGIDQKHG